MASALLTSSSPCWLLPRSSPRRGCLRRNDRALESGSQAAMKRTRLVVAMALTLACVLAVAVWDERREARAALDDFAAEQTAVARTAARSPGGSGWAPRVAASQEVPVSPKP